MLKKVLIANRGEIALRIQRACRELGIATVAVYSEADAGARHLRLADQALCIGRAHPTHSYLNKHAIVQAARLCGADAVHPGYGFLSENAEFAQLLEDAGIVFIGPLAKSIRVMGDKIAAKQAMLAAGVPCVPGSDGALPADVDALKKMAHDIGYPVIVKAAGGGGGKGMRVVQQESDLAEAVALTREEARRAFGNPELYMEKFLQHPRHVEIQVMCDNHGNAFWLGARDCSMQRRHQKVMEEAPAPGIAAPLLEQVGQRCVEACRQIDYRGAGTFEFLFEDGRFYFIEMNTRLQVEHPVTEMTSGIDIVQAQLRVASGEALRLRQQDIQCNGHAIECRINAEDPYSFAPSPGTISTWELPGGHGVRVDSHAGVGYTVPPYYDSMIAKLIVHAPTREEALARMRAALAEMRVSGVSTNLALHGDLMTEPGFAAGGVNIHHLEHWLKHRNAP